MEPKKLYIYNGIESELEEINDLKDVKNYIKDYIEYGDIHPDIESIIILEQIGGVTVDETGEETKLNGDVVPICKVDVFVDKDMTDKKYTEEDVLKYAWFLVENIGQYACDKTANFEGKYLEQFKNKQD